MARIIRFVHSGAAKGGALLLMGLMLGFLLGYWRANLHADSLITSIKNSFNPIQESSAGHIFIRPLLAYRTPEATTLGEYQSLKSEVQTAIDHAISSSSVSRVSVYFRDLDAARWIGISQNDTYYPASLLKVPVMIAYYKEAEINPSILNESVVYQTLPKDDSFEAPSELVPGTAYTIQKLIEHMIIDSDNGATFTLLARINPDLLSSVYSALGITSPGDDSSTYQISTRTYALFFRILYNATYLSPEYSEKALDLLTKATFENGLVAGVPKGTLVANKYGEHVTSEQGQATGVEIHNCGVIYHPSHPYLLCIMTSAKDVPSATTIIKNISSITYNAIGEHYQATSTPY